jgi:hypothetical protein
VAALDRSERGLSLLLSDPESLPTPPPPAPRAN